MPGKTSQLTSLAARKRLLLMESELNRTKMVNAIEGWKGELRHAKEQLTRLTSIASVVGQVAAAIPAITGLFSNRKVADKKPKLPFLLNSLRTGTSLWLLFRSLRRK